jgi:hypothetical protein
MSNPTQEYNDYIRANLPLGITYDEVRARYVTDNGKYFPTYLEAKWYLDYTIKFGFIPSPASLFANGEQGAWYDPSDLTTLYQDAAGTTPVTADGDPVGLMLDKSQGLKRGPELVDSSVGVADSSFVDRGTQTHIDGDVWELETTSTSETEFGVVTATPNGFFDTTKFYEIVVTVDLFDVSDSGHVLSLLFSRGQNSRVTSAFLSISDTGVYYVRTKANRDTLTFRTDGGTATIGDKIRLSISVRELPGNHATQSTAAARPVYRTDGTLHWLEFDGVDDDLSAFMDFGAITEMEIAAGLRYQQVDDNFYTLTALSNATGYVQAYTFFDPGREYFAFQADVTSRVTAGSGSDPAFAPPRLLVFVGTYDISAPLIRARVDGVTVIGNTLSSGETQIGSGTYFIGSRGEENAPMRYYGGIALERRFLTGELNSVETYLASKSGVTL